MRRLCAISIAAMLSLTSGAVAQTSTLTPGLSSISFLVGTWTSGVGTVADTGATSRGSSTITPEADGSVLLRRDHTDLFSADGKPSGSFDQIMMIYAEGANVHADYSDGEHIIHYTSATITPGRSISFNTMVSATAPAFRLTYEQTDSQTLAVRFESAAPGQTVFHPIATGVLHKRSP